MINHAITVVVTPLACGVCARRHDGEPYKHCLLCGALCWRCCCSRKALLVTHDQEQACDYFDLIQQKVSWNRLCLNGWCSDLGSTTGMAAVVRVLPFGEV